MLAASLRAVPVVFSSNVLPVVTCAVAASGRWKHFQGHSQRAPHSTTATAATANPEAATPHDAHAADSSITDASKYSSAAGLEPKTSSFIAPHPGMHKSPWGVPGIAVPADVASVMRHPVYTREYMESIQPKHLPPKELHERLAFRTISTVRRAFDLATGYRPDKVMTEAQWLRRIIFLETVAGVPGMVGGMLRHLRSLRLMQRDNGWINTLLEEAENERMHLLTFMEMRKPGWVFRSAVLAAQGIMFNLLFVAYLVSPKFCHSLVGFLEEAAVVTYTHAIKDIDAGHLWPNRPAPPIAQAYWRLPADATMRDLVLAVRADEACHSHVNHTFAGLSQDQENPFAGKDSTVLP